jgi:hypothetical protein
VRVRNLFMHQRPEASALTVLFGLVAVGQIVFRKIDGHAELAAFLVKEQWLQAV